jgi:hypothetical protein
MYINERFIYWYTNNDFTYRAIIKIFGGINKMKTKLFGLLAVFLIGILAVCGVANALIDIDEVYFDGTELTEDGITTLDVERGNDYDVKIVFTPTENLTGVQVEAYLRGYDHEDLVEDISDVFDAKAGVTYSKKLSLNIPQRMDIDNSNYSLRVRVEGQNGVGQSEIYNLEISTGRHLIDIKDVVFSPEDSVKAGRALLTSVRVKNYGQKDEDGIKVAVSIPELGISASDYIDELEADESTTSEELYLRIPSCAEAGSYDAKVTVTYDDGDEVAMKTAKIIVTEDETCGAAPATTGSQPATTVAQKPTIVYDSSAQDINVGGAGAIYALTISNPTNTAKTVMVGVSGVDVFGSARVSPSNVMVIGSGETKTVYVYVTASKDARAGQYNFVATVSGLGANSQEISLAAKVNKGSASLDTVKRALEIGLIVLVVILVVLGLIIGFNKMRKKEESEETTQTYY